MERPLILYDLGRVLVKLEPERAFHTLAELSGLSIKETMKRLNGAELANLMDLGHMRELCDYVSIQLGKVTPHKIIDSYLDIHTDLDRDMISLRDKYEQAGIVTGILSNSSAASRGFIRGRWPEVFQCTGPQLYSDLAGVMKPKKDIYSTLNWEGPVIFIDDKEENLVAPEELGWTCIHFNSESERDLTATNAEELQTLISKLGYRA